MIQMILLDRWNPHRLDKKIAFHFALSLDQVRDIRQQPAFLEELERQRLISEQPFVNLADRRTGGHRFTEFRRFILQLSGVIGAGSHQHESEDRDK